MAKYIQTIVNGQKYINQISDIEVARNGQLIFFTMHFNKGPKHLYLYRHHSFGQIANDLFRGALTARSVKGLLQEFVELGEKSGWAVGSAVALTDFLTKNYNFKAEGYYDAAGKREIDVILTERDIITK